MDAYGATPMSSLVWFKEREKLECWSTVFLFMVRKYHYYYYWSVGGDVVTSSPPNIPNVKG